MNLNTDKTELVTSSIDALQNCSKTLTEISTTCCAPARSPTLNKAIASVDELMLMIKDSKNDHLKTHQCIEEIGALGSQVGYLYASCCTATREPMYQNIFKELMTAHTNLWEVVGTSH